MGNGVLTLPLLKRRRESDLKRSKIPSQKWLLFITLQSFFNLSTRCCDCSGTLVEQHSATYFSLVHHHQQKRKAKVIYLYSSVTINAEVIGFETVFFSSLFFTQHPLSTFLSDAILPFNHAAAAAANQNNSLCNFLAHNTLQQPRFQSSSKSRMKMFFHTARMIWG